MDYHLPKSMLNRYLSWYVRGQERPVFYDIDRVYPSLNEITRHYGVIRREFEAVLERQVSMPRYHDVDSGERAISDTTPGNWKVFMFEVLGHRSEANRALCPETSRVLDRIPNMIQAFFSILDPKKSIPEHEGPYLGYLRYHLALRVPTIEPPSLVVKKQPYVWKEGEAVLFDDSWPHAVINNSPQMRAVLIIDVMRPLPLIPRLVNRLVTNVIARHTYGRKVAQKVEQSSSADSSRPRKAA